MTTADMNSQYDASLRGAVRALGILTFVFSFVVSSDILAVCGVGAILVPFIVPSKIPYFKTNFDKTSLPYIDSFSIPVIVILPAVIYFVMTESLEIVKWLTFSLVVTIALGHVRRKMHLDRPTDAPVQAANTKPDRQNKSRPKAAWHSKKTSQDPRSSISNIRPTYIKVLFSSLLSVSYVISKWIICSLLLLVVLQFLLNVFYLTGDRGAVEEVWLALSDVQVWMKHALSAYWFVVIALLCLFMVRVLPQLRIPPRLMHARALVEKAGIVLTVLTSFSFFATATIDVQEPRWIAKLQAKDGLQGRIEANADAQRKVVAANMLSQRIATLTTSERLALVDSIQRFGRDRATTRELASQLAPPSGHRHGKNTEPGRTEAADQIERVHKTVLSQTGGDATIRDIVEYRQAAPEIAASLEEAKDSLANIVTDLLIRPGTTSTVGLVDMFVESMIQEIVKTTVEYIEPFDVRDAATASHWARLMNRSTAETKPAERKVWWFAEPDTRPARLYEANQAVAALVEKRAEEGRLRRLVDDTIKQLTEFKDKFSTRDELAAKSSEERFYTRLTTGAIRAGSPPTDQHNSQIILYEDLIETMKGELEEHLFDLTKRTDSPQKIKIYFRSDVDLYFYKISSWWRMELQLADPTRRSALVETVNSVAELFDDRTDTPYERLNKIMAIMRRNAEVSEYEPSRLSLEEYDRRAQEYWDSQRRETLESIRRRTRMRARMRVGK